MPVFTKIAHINGSIGKRHSNSVDKHVSNVEKTLVYQQTESNFQKTE
jgi:hypothetical protein